MNENIELLFRVRTQGREDLDKIRASINGTGAEVIKVEEAVRKFDGSFSKLTNTLARVTGVNQETVGSFLQLSTGAGAAGLALAGVTVAAALTVGTMVTLASKTSDLAQKQVILAAATNLSVKEVGILSTMSTNAGLSAGTLSKAVDELSNRLAEVGIKGDLTRRAVRELGVSFETQYGSSRKSSEVFLELGTAIGRIEDPAAKARAAIAVFGKEGLEILPALRGDLKETATALQNIGVGIDDNALRTLQRYNDLWNQVKNRLDGVVTALGIISANGILKTLDFLGTAPEDFGKKQTDDVVRYQKQLREIEAKTPQQLQDDLRNSLGNRLQPGEIEGGENRKNTVPFANSKRIDITNPEKFKQLNEGYIRARIQRFLEQFETLEERISREKRKLDEYVKENDEINVRRQQGKILGLEAEKDARGRDKRIDDAARSQSKSVRDFIEGVSLSGDANSKFYSSQLDKIADINDKTPLSEGVRQRLLEVLDEEMRRRGYFQNLPRDPRSSRNAINFLRPRNVDQVDVSDDLLKKQADDIQKLRERSLSSIQSYAQFQEQIVRLTAGPGGEAAAVERISAIRLQAAEREFAITKDRAKFEDEITAIQRGRQVELLQLAQKRRDTYREAAGRVFDAGLDGGITGLIQGQARIQGRTIFQNTSEKIFTSFGSTLGKVGQASGLGDLLKGTLFDPANAQSLQVENNSELRQNTQALKQVRLQLAGGAVGGSLGLDGLPFSTSGTAGGVGLALGGLRNSVGQQIGKFTNSAAGRGATTFLGALASPISAGLFAGLRGGDFSIQTADGRATTASAAGLNTAAGRAGNLVGSGAVLAAGTLGIVSGLREGGARGATTAVGSALGIASTLPGPQQPFIQAAALVAGLVRGLFPDPKKEREDAITGLLNRNRYDSPSGRDVYMDTYGRELDYDARGRVRVIERPIQVSIQALDANSIMDRRADLADALKAAIQGGHDVSDTITRNVLNA